MAEFTETNRKHFDTVATTHQPNFASLITHAIQELQDRRLWISPKWTDTAPSTDAGIRLLDYACGSGTVSKALAPYTTRTIGLDLSENMVGEYNRIAAKMGLFPERMRGYQFDLISSSSTSMSASTTSDTEPELAEELSEGFDMIVIGIALHHVAFPGLLLQRLKEILKPGGVVVVLDMVPDQVPSVPTDIDFDTEGLKAQEIDVLKTIWKQGFTEGEMRAMYKCAGLEKNFKYVSIEEEFRFRLFGREVDVKGFICRGEVI